MERKPLYRIVMTCWDAGKELPYPDSFGTLFDSEEKAREMLRACVKEELETLNERPIEDIDLDYPSEIDTFKADFDGDEYDAIVRMWDGDDYWPVTGYQIHVVTPIWERSWMYRVADSHIFIICANEKQNRFLVQFAGEGLAVKQSLMRALDVVDKFILDRESSNKRRVSNDRRVEDEKEWLLPVTWEVCGFVKVKASSIGEAIERFRETEDDIPLPMDSSYIDGSFSLSTDDENEIALYQKTS